MAASGMAMSSGEMSAQSSGATEFYLLRRYALRNGPQLALVQDYFQHALVPALNRMGIPAVGTFKLDIGPETPSYYLLVPSTSAETLLTLDTKLAQDADFAKAASAFWSAPATATAFERVESRIMSAFQGFPKIAIPKQGKRIFQLRTYESPGYAAHVTKVEMFEKGEIAIFQKTGLTPVLFAHDLTGPRLPSLTYMLTFTDMAESTAHWAAFVSDPAWKEISHRPGYSDAEIVSNITNLFLSPLPSSQI